MPLDNEKEMLKNIHSARGELYAFLSRFFSSVPNYQMLADMAPKLEPLAENTDNEEIKSGVKGLTTFLKKRNALSGKELSAFDIERSRHYTTLLCLPKSIPTDESVYTSPEHQTREKSYFQVKALFEKYEMKKSENISENEDFIGYELLFMSKLAYDCAGFIEAGEEGKYREWLKAQYNFHVDHFDRWVYDFYDAVISYGIEDEILYQYLARLAHGFTKEDKLTLEDLLTQ